MQQGQFLSLRRVGAADCKQLWQWANDPVVRQSSFSPDPIAWNDHCRWFEQKLQDTQCYMYLAFDQKQHPVGQIRFDRVAPYQAEIDVSIAPTKRGYGYGRQLIQLGVAQMFQTTGVTSVYALIKVDNQASIKAFTEAGFSSVVSGFDHPNVLKYVKANLPSVDCDA